MNKYPIYIISKGRWETRLTAKELERIGTPYRIVVEPQEFDNYASVIDRNKILVLPFSNLGLGGIPARNWVWEHSISEGHKRHWILDDNISAFRQFKKGRRIIVDDGSNFEGVENFTDKYSNVPMSGMQYSMFAVSDCQYQGKVLPPVIFNTRIYSCILLSNEEKYNQFRWRGRYNEDTDLSIRFLKAGYCTILFYAFLCDKKTTMTMKGGNTESLYKLKGVDGRLLMAMSLKNQHPDVVKIYHRWGKWQHLVDYRSFKGNKLIKKSE